MKKKIIMMAALCAVGTAATAQLEKGRLMIGGNVGYFRSNQESQFYNHKLKSLSISPTAGYFIKDNLAIGTSLRYYSNKINASNYIQKQSSYALIPFIRYYLNISSEFSFFAEFALAAGIGNSEEFALHEPYYRKESKYKEYGAALAPGLAFLPAKRWSVNLRFNLLDYSNTQVKDLSDDAENKHYVGSNQFNFGFNTIRPSIGVNYHL
ncbi:outer membrane beta-barrel protein [Pedobacter sp. PLR]|uniref:outer membrane beta-barrel protein n=1 Tax=Pedobacter sp. PLR TaxID=2994465 RepID=UPI0022459A17|nr:outer membrane beta-barrel protein [Pedobacter sp. PLR]MCX2451974.1 outer membrane beta-barrel protein [Pedobacter sp. PLR]